MTYRIDETRPEVALNIGATVETNAASSGTAPDAPGGAFAGFSRARDLALFLDIDGTLVDIAARPDQVRAPADLADLLARACARLGGALALISGRALADIDALTLPLTFPAAGVHGAELRLSARTESFAAAPPLGDEFVSAVRAIAGPRLVEPKRYAVAIHYRDAPQDAPRLARELRALTRAAGEDLEVMDGRMVLEIKSRRTTKGEALAAFMRVHPFLGRTPLMIGDDSTDESAMAVARTLGGYGLKVAGEHFSKAEADFADPDAVRRFLGQFALGDER